MDVHRASWPGDRSGGQPSNGLTNAQQYCWDMCVPEGGLILSDGRVEGHGQPSVVRGNSIQIPVTDSAATV